MKDNTSILYLYKNGDSGFSSSPTIDIAATTMAKRCATREVTAMTGITFIGGKSVAMEFVSCVKQAELVRLMKWMRYYWLGWDGSKFISSEELEELHQKNSAEIKAIYETM